MAFNDMKLIEVLNHPQKALALSPRQQSDLLAEAHFYNMLGQLQHIFKQASIFEQLASKTKTRLNNFEYHHKNQVKLLTEEHEYLVEAMSNKQVPWCYLKGAAYHFSGIEGLKGRMMNDIDLLVDKRDLEKAERNLLEQGYLHKKISDYDDKFYREYTQEIPPLRHYIRNIVLDMHFNIIPPILNQGTDKQYLARQTQNLTHVNATVLKPAAMFYHSAIHLFSESEFFKGTRDIYDLYVLLQTFKEEPDFTRQLIEIESKVGDGKSIYWALRFVHRYFDIYIPQELVSYFEQFKPGWLAEWFLVPSFHYAFSDYYSRNRTCVAKWYEFVLFSRGHIKRLPPFVLISHTIKKLFVKLKRTPEVEESIF